MKPIYFFLYLLFVAGAATAQPGVAINTNGNAPHNSAMLDVQSTNKGFLLPRMSQAQRLAINNPEAGLLVFDTDAQKLFQFQDGVWRFLIDNSYWAGSSTRNWVYNGTDSVGIGTAAPTEKLHVSNGNFKLSNGDLKLDLGDIFINKSDGIIQLQAAGESKGFVQLSGNDLRIGTNLTNTEGKLIVRTQGANQVTISQDGLELTGNGKITRTNTGTNNLIPACYGQIREDGTIIFSTPGVNVTHGSGTGYYFVSLPGINLNSVALITPSDSNVRAKVESRQGYIWVTFANIETNGLQDASFNFIVFNP